MHDWTRPLVVEPGTEGASASSSVSGELREILNLADLGADVSVRPKSIRGWAGRQVYERTEDILAARTSWASRASITPHASSL